MDARTDRIRTNLDDAERTKGEAQSILDEYQRQLADAKNEANRIIEEARQTADSLRRDLVAATEADVAELRQRSAEDIAAAQDRRSPTSVPGARAGHRCGRKGRGEEPRPGRQTPVVENYINSVGSGSLMSAEEHDERRSAPAAAGRRLRGRVADLAKAEGSLETVEDELFKVARTIEANDQLLATLTDQAIPVDRRQGIVEDLLGGKASAVTTDWSADRGYRPRSRPPRHHRRPRRPGGRGAPGGGRPKCAPPSRSTRTSAPGWPMRSARPPASTSLSRSSSIRPCSAASSPASATPSSTAPSATVSNLEQLSDPGTKFSDMSDITLRRRHPRRHAQGLAGFTPTIASNQVGAGGRGRRRHRPRLRPPGCVGQRAARVPRRRARARPQPRRGVDRCGDPRSADHIEEGQSVRRPAASCRSPSATRCSAGS